MFQHSRWLVASVLLAGLLAIILAWGWPYPAAASNVAMAESRTGSIRASAAVTESH